MDLNEKMKRWDLVEDSPDVEEQLPDMIDVPLPSVEALKKYKNSFYSVITVSGTVGCGTGTVLVLVGMDYTLEVSRPKENLHPKSATKLKSRIRIGRKMVQV